MAIFKLADRVKETSATTGTGTLTLDGTPSGFRTFLSGVGSGNSCSYSINDNSGNWENGIGVVGATTLTRPAANVLSGSSGAGVNVNFSAPSLDVWIDVPAARVNPVLLQRTAVTAVATIDFTGIDTTYDVLEFRWYNVQSGDGTALWLRISIAASFLAANYSFERSEFAVSALTHVTSAAQAQIVLNSNVGATTIEASSGVLTLFNPSQTSFPKDILWQSFHRTSGPTITSVLGAGSYTGANSAVDGVRFMPSGGGNFVANGHIEMLGYRSA